MTVQTLQLLKETLNIAIYICENIQYESLQLQVCQSSILSKQILRAF